MVVADLTRAAPRRIIGALVAGVVAALYNPAMRRFGLRGAIGLVVGFMVYGATRDYATASLTGLIVLADGALPFIADTLAWGSGTSLPFVAMRVFSGPAGSVPLARRSPRATGLEGAGRSRTRFPTGRIRRKTERSCDLWRMR